MHSRRRVVQDETGGGVDGLIGTLAVSNTTYLPTYLPTAIMMEPEFDLGLWSHLTRSIEKERMVSEFCSSNSRMLVSNETLKIAGTPLITTLYFGMVIQAP
jgi:hypothetical protein